jgi:hypothetical protein
VDDIVRFADTNQYQQPMPTPELIEDFDNVFKEVLVIYEQIKVLPDYLPKDVLEDLSNYYIPAVEALSFMINACPDPEAALSWFDYQQEYKSRAKQLKNLTTLLDWQQSIYLAIVERVPELPVPTIPVIPELSQPLPSLSDETSPSCSEETAKLYL